MPAPTTMMRGPLTARMMPYGGVGHAHRCIVPPMASPESRGVAAGRFAPFHRGHQHLIERARGMVDALDVVVMHGPDDQLAPELRTGWIRDAFAEHPQVQVHAVADDDDPVAAVAARIGSTPDMCFTGAGHNGWSTSLGTRHVEIARLPGIDSRIVGADALAALDQLPGGTRASVVRRVCVLGAESTGKTTVARDLADALATVWVPEYGRDYTETLPDRLRYVWTTPDFEIISKRQNWNEDRAARYANRIVIVDTDAFATSLFHELYVGYRAPELDAYLRQYDLYLLTSIDTPFQMDTTGLRYDGDTRRFMDATYRRHAEESGQAVGRAPGPAAGAAAHRGRRGGDDARALRGPGRAHRPARTRAGARRGALSSGLRAAAREHAVRGRLLGGALESGAIAEERDERDGDRAPGDARDGTGGPEALQQPRPHGRLGRPPHACVEHASDRGALPDGELLAAIPEGIRRSRAVRALGLGRRHPQLGRRRERRVQNADQVAAPVDGVVVRDRLLQRRDREQVRRAAARHPARRAPQLVRVPSERARVLALDQRRALAQRHAVVEAAVGDELLAARELVVRRAPGGARETAAVVAGDTRRILRAEGGRAGPDVGGARIRGRRSRRCGRGQRDEQEQRERGDEPCTHASNVSQGGGPAHATDG